MFDVTATREQIAAEVRAELARQNKPAGVFLTELLGIDQGSVSRRLNATRPFGAEEIAAIAKALGVPVSRFLGGERAA